MKRNGKEFSMKRFEENGSRIQFTKWIKKKKWWTRKEREKIIRKEIFFVLERWRMEKAES